MIRFVRIIPEKVNKEDEKWQEVAGVMHHVHSGCSDFYDIVNATQKYDKDHHEDDWWKTPYYEYEQQVAWALIKAVEYGFCKIEEE